ncbi:MAG TPA: hypothetical protein VKV77_04905 [Methylovirgula sp.]|nr:hypothetical protein [Methylovirgula sp.]
MKLLILIAATISLIFAGMSAAAAGSYEFVVVPPATGSMNPAIFRINVATGQVVSVWGWGADAKAYAPVVEPAPLPVGDYHMSLVEALDQKGNWEIVRYETQSGRTWSLTGGGNAPFTWAETAPPPSETAAAPAPPPVAPSQAPAPNGIAPTQSPSQNGVAPRPAQ